VSLGSGLFEKVRERGVIEQGVRRDRLSLVGNGLAPMDRFGPGTPPAGVADALDLAGDPQLVHDFAQPVDTGVGDERVKVRQAVPAIRFHSLEDDPGVVAQPLPGGVHSDMTAAPAFWPPDAAHR
jgi:hypothetical protein